MTATMSIDGRIALWPQRILLEPDVGAAWAALQSPGAATLLAERSRLLNERFGPTTAVLSGSGSFVTEPGGPLPPMADDPGDLLHDFLPEVICAQPGHQGWFVVTDSRGRVRWAIKRVDGSDLLVLVTRSTPPEYLATCAPSRSATWWSAAIGSTSALPCNGCRIGSEWRVCSRMAAAD